MDFTAFEIINTAKGDLPVIKEKSTNKILSEKEAPRKTFNCTFTEASGNNKIDIDVAEYKAGRFVGLDTDYSYYRLDVVEKSSDTLWLILGIVGILVFVIAIIAIANYIRKRRENRNQEVLARTETLVPNNI
jgi:hypothetical protein